MPQPWFFADVAFDAAGAEAAIATLQRVRRTIWELGDARARAAREATAAWQGRFREEYDCDFSVSQGRLAAMEARIDAAIARIRLGEERAHAEQAQRHVLRRRHEEELADARRRAALSATS